MRIGKALRLFCALALVALSTVVLLAGHAQIGTNGTAGAATAHGSVSCPSETSTCVQMAFPCPAGNCSISAGPVSNLLQGQSVWVSVSGLAVNDELEVAFCSISQGAQIVPQPQCASEIPAPPTCIIGPTNTCSQTPTPLGYQYLPVTTGVTTVSIATEYDPNIAGAVPITSQTASQFSNNDTTGSFFCDNAANPCALEVMDVPSNTDIVANGFPPRATFSASSSNSVVLPLSWSGGGSGCGSAPVLSVDAAYSAEHFLPAAGGATCTGPNGIAPLGTELPSVDDPGCSTGGGTHCPITSLINGDVPVTFTDDPEDPGTQAELKKAGGQFAFIPIVASATEVAFLGEAATVIAGNGFSTPLTSYRMTPSQTAGVLTQLWSAPIALSGVPNDNVCHQLPLTVPCSEWSNQITAPVNVETSNGSYANIDVQQGSLTPQKIPITFYTWNGDYSHAAQASEKNYAGQTGYALLNPWPTPLGEATFGATFPSTASGSVYALTNWFCGAPGVPYSVGLPWSSGTQASVHDLMSSQQILTNAEQGPLEISKGIASSTVSQTAVANPKKCRAISTLPTNFANATNPGTLYKPSSSPILTAHAMQGAFGSTALNAQGGFDFSSMDSSEADFYGLYPVALQNAAGQFVLPNQSSVDAALNDVTANPDGTVSPSVTNSADAAAYPLPMVTYALVSTSPQAADQAAQLKQLLTNLVNYQENAGTGSTAPLPPGYVSLPSSLYQQALADISKDINGPSGSNTSSSSGNGAGGSGSGANGASGANGVHGGAGTNPLARSGHGAGSSRAGAAGGLGAGRGSTAPVSGRLISVSVGFERFFVPLLLLLAILCLIGGPMLYMYPTLRDQRAARRRLAADGAASAEPEPHGDP